MYSLCLLNSNAGIFVAVSHNLTEKMQSNADMIQTSNECLFLGLFSYVFFIFDSKKKIVIRTNAALNLLQIC